MKKITLEAAMTEALIEECTRDPNLIVFGDNSTTGAGLFSHKAFDEAFPNNVMNMPVTESMYPNVGVGMALAGLRRGRSGCPALRPPALPARKQRPPGALLRP